MNFFDDYFSYIKVMNMFSKCYICKKCDKSFYKVFKLTRYERGCEVRVRFEYFGGVYYFFKIIFEKIEEEGIFVF